MERIIYLFFNFRFFRNNLKWVRLTTSSNKLKIPHQRIPSTIANLRNNLSITLNQHLPMIIQSPRVFPQNQEQSFTYLRKKKKHKEISHKFITTYTTRNTQIKSSSILETGKIFLSTEKNTHHHDDRDSVPSFSLKYLPHTSPFFWVEPPQIPSLHDVLRRQTITIDNVISTRPLAASKSVKNREHAASHTKYYLLM